MYFINNYRIKIVIILQFHYYSDPLATLNSKYVIKNVLVLLF